MKTYIVNADGLTAREKNPYFQRHVRLAWKEFESTVQSYPIITDKPLGPGSEIECELMYLDNDPIDLPKLHLQPIEQPKEEKKDMKTNLNELSKSIHANNEIRGFWDGGIEAKNIGEVLCLIHSEVSEALEADRKNHHASKSFNLNQIHSIPLESQYEKQYYKQEFEALVKNSFEDELADIIIRVLDVCGAMKIDIDYHIEAKLKYNSLREFKHGKKY